MRNAPPLPRRGMRRTSRRAYSAGDGALRGRSIRDLPAHDRHRDHHQFHRHPCHASRSDRRHARAHGGRAGSSVAGGAQIVKVYTKAFALDQPLYGQYLLYVKNLLIGDLGYSLAYFPQKVSAVVLRAVPWSLGLLLFLGAACLHDRQSAGRACRMAPRALAAEGADLFLHDAVSDAVLPASADPPLPLRLPLADLPDGWDVHRRQLARVRPRDPPRHSPPRGCRRSRSRSG